MADTHQTSDQSNNFYIDRFFEELRTVIEDRHTQQWRDDALCKGVGPDRFFSGRGDNDAVDSAQALCEACPVQTECAEYAMANRFRYGIWGGIGASKLKSLAAGRPFQPRTCAMCNATYAPSAPMQTYCSELCQQRRRRQHDRRVG